MSQLTFTPADRIAEIGEYFFAKANRRISAVIERGLSVINLGVGSPDLPPPPAVVTDFQQHVANPVLHGYPSYAGLPELKTALAAWYGREYQVDLDAKTMILPLAGSKEGLVFLTQAVINPGDVVLIPDLGYATYARAATLAGGELVFYHLDPNNGYLPNFSNLEAATLSRAKLLWINYPHNPTGATASLADLAAIVDFARQHNLIIGSDNPYSHLVFDDNKPVSILQVPGAMEVAVEFDTFSKTYNMAGWRLAWAAGNPQLIEYLTTTYSNVESGLFVPLQLAGVTALQTPTTWVQACNKIYSERRELLVKILETLRCEPFTAHASLYVWAKVPTNINNVEEYCFDVLEKTGVFLTPGTVFGQVGEGYVRVAICQSTSVLQLALERLKTYVN